MDRPSPHVPMSRIQTNPESERAGALESFCLRLGQQARAAARRLAVAKGKQRNDWLHCVADCLLTRTSEILSANSRDLELAAQLGLSTAATDRLRLSIERLQALASSVRAVAALPDPIGQVRDCSVRPNGLQVVKVGVPLGVIFFIYESRPNVTVDAAALCIKSGNAIILRGGKEAHHSNRALSLVLQDCLDQVRLPRDAVQFVDTPDRSAVGYLLELAGEIDLVIPRGGESLIRRVAAEARMPVLKHYKGNCHVYIDDSADLAMAEAIVINAKCQRPAVCNAAESLLVHRRIAAVFLPRVAQALTDRGVQLRGCPETRRLIPEAVPATEEDYAAEFLDLIYSVKVVDALEEAIEHINKYGSKHTDAIITSSLNAARRFTEAVDSAAVMVNASTRFHDGFEFGLGAEIGISTDKFHARGPSGLVELTSYKYVVFGDGQVRSE
jgi:glutamate-5-semialdehyde dehydrogenase